VHATNVESNGTKGNIDITVKHQQRSGKEAVNKMEHSLEFEVPPAWPALNVSLGSLSNVKRTSFYDRTSSAENRSRSSNLPLGHLATSVIHSHGQMAALTFDSISGRHYCCAETEIPLNHQQRHSISMFATSTSGLRGINMIT
jgi:hypothetical protein